MKTITVIGTCLLILCFAAAGMSFAADKGDVTKSDVKKEAPSGLDKPKPSADQEKQDYIKQIETTLDDVSKKINELKDKAQTRHRRRPRQNRLHHYYAQGSTGNSYEEAARTAFLHRRGLG